MKARMARKLYYYALQCLPAIVHSPLACARGSVSES
jgi:hypothetical protein